MNKTYNIIYTEDNIVAVGELKSFPDEAYYKPYLICWRNNTYEIQGGKNNSMANSRREISRQIIASTNPIKGIPLMILEDNIEQLAETTIWNDITVNTGNVAQQKIGFIKGYKATTKKYTEEDMKKLYLGTLQNVGTSVKKADMPTWEQVLQSLQPKYSAVEFEMIPSGKCTKDRCLFHPCNGVCHIPKIMNNHVVIKKIII